MSKKKGTIKHTCPLLSATVAFYSTLHPRVMVLVVGIRAGQYILILTIYIDIVNIYDIDIGINIEFQPGPILIMILTRVLISISIYEVH